MISNLSPSSHTKLNLQSKWGHFKTVTGVKKLLVFFSKLIVFKVNQFEKNIDGYLLGNAYANYETYLTQRKAKF